MSDLIVSVSGIRGIVGESLTPEVVLDFARALGTKIGPGQMVALSRDNRPSGIMLGAAAAAGLLSVGCKILNLGITPTPTVGVMIRERKLMGGIQISASHNPAPWNGLKLFGADGAVLAPAEGAQVVEIFKAKTFKHARLYSSLDFTKAPSRGDVQSAGSVHTRFILQQIDPTIIQKSKFSVFVDANGGAGGPLSRELLEECLGCHVQGLGLLPSDGFSHTPEPTEENLRNVCPMVKENMCDIGFVLDPDADRLAIIDENSRYIGEELTLALALEYVLRQRKGPVVVNMSTSRVNEDIAMKHGCTFHRSAVGEANVTKLMRELEAVYGGEGNGGIIDPQVGWVRDPYTGMAMILSLMAMEQKPLSAIVDSLPRYVIQKDKYTVPPENLPALYERLMASHSDATKNRIDGLRLDWNDRWVHVRPSNTEPIVRVIAEAPTAELAQSLCLLVGKLVTNG